jgi:hypothetical protein
MTTICCGASFNDGGIRDVVWSQNQAFANRGDKKRALFLEPVSILALLALRGLCQ